MDKNSSVFHIVLFNYHPSLYVHRPIALAQVQKKNIKIGNGERLQ